MTTDSIISKVWSFCTTLRDDGVGSRDNTSLDLFWMKDRSLADLDNLPDPKDLGEEIVENIEAGSNNFRVVVAALGK